MSQRYLKKGEKGQKLYPFMVIHTFHMARCDSLQG